MYRSAYRKDYFFYCVVAFQYGHICNVMDYGRAETFDELDILRKQIITTRHGEIRPIDKICIDSRGIKERTKLVIEWVEKTTES